MSFSRIVQLAAVIAASVLALAPRPPLLIQDYYASRFYPALQAVLTRVSNVAPFALSDILLVFVSATLLSVWIRAGRRAWQDRRARPLLSALLATASVAAGAYLWFSCVWGLNYARRPLADSLPVDLSRVSVAEVVALGSRAVHEANVRFHAAHASGFPDVHAVPTALAAALHETEARLGRGRASTPGRPKWTLLAPYFRASGTDGLTSPFLLEVLINPDLTGPERPVVLAHEWAHLSGYAAEDEAGFIAVITSLKADISSQYSGWLAVAMDAASQLPGDSRRQVLSQLAEGPRRDQALIARRLEKRVMAVQRVGWMVYDRYLRSQGVDEGVFSYGRVIELLAGLDPDHPLSWRNL